MEKIVVKNVTKLLIGARIIGIGSTAICFLLKNGKVLKLFLETYNKQRLFWARNMPEHLSFLSELNNEYYIAPVELVYDEVGNIIGYIMEYCDAKTIWRFKRNIVVQDLVEAFEVLDENTYLISERNFQLKDIHAKNVLFNIYFYVIDLDNGEINMDFTIDRIHDQNMRKLAKTIVNSLFKIDTLTDTYFYNVDLNEAYVKMVYRDYKYFYEVINLLESTINFEDLEIGDLRSNKRKLLRVEKTDDYHHKIFL